MIWQAVYAGFEYFSERLPVTFVYAGIRTAGHCWPARLATRSPAGAP